VRRLSSGTATTTELLRFSPVVVTHSAGPHRRVRGGFCLTGERTRVDIVHRHEHARRATACRGARCRSFSQTAVLGGRCSDLPGRVGLHCAPPHRRRGLARPPVGATVDHVAHRSGPVPRTGDQHARIAAAAVWHHGLTFHTAKAVGFLLYRSDHIPRQGLRLAFRVPTEVGRWKADGAASDFRLQHARCVRWARV
jgi:hypothetical protein